MVNITSMRRADLWAAEIEKKGHYPETRVSHTVRSSYINLPLTMPNKSEALQQPLIHKNIYLA